MLARWWAWEFESWLRRLCSYSPGGGDQPLEHLAEVVDAAGLELHRRDRRGRAPHEGERLAGSDPVLLDHSLDLGGDLDHVGVAAGREAELDGVQGDGAKLVQPGAPLIRSLQGGVQAQEARGQGGSLERA